jgi:malonyl-CoA/methylmalonyl-CoA synthetase
VTLTELARDHSGSARTRADMKQADLAALLYTSGTTGRSKGAMLTRANLATNAITLAQEWRFTERDVLLHALPIFHVHGLFVAINTVLAAGSSMLFLPKFDADEVVRLLPEATVMMGVPTFYTRLLQHSAFTRERCASIRFFVSGQRRCSPNASRVSRAHRARDPRTLWHERDADEHVQSLRRRARAGLRGPAAARCRGAHRRSRVGRAAA